MRQTYQKKLIEVALPLPEINDASAYDKMPGIGPHPKGIHHWWARLPLPTARAVLFASVVTDPSDDPKWKDRSEKEQIQERERLFDILRRMMQKRLHQHPEVYAEAQAEMRKHCNGKLPTVFDPFAGGGSIPLEANRLGFEAHAGDLNPVAVLLNKCNLEIAPRWAGHPPVNPSSRAKIGGGKGWTGTQGLAEDVRYYGNIIRERAIAKIGHLYPKVTLPGENGGGEADVIAWFWARTVASDNAAARGKHVPLISTYWLSSKKGKLAWLEPIVDKEAGTYRFEVRTGIPSNRNIIAAGTKLGRGAKFKCLLTGEPISDAHVKKEAKAKRLCLVPIAIVADGKKGRIYLPITDKNIPIVPNSNNLWSPEGEIPQRLTGGTCYGYGLTSWGDIFTSRQALAMVTLLDLINEIKEVVRQDISKTKMPSEEEETYCTAITTFLSLSLDRCADFNNALCRWKPSGEQSMQLFARQAIPMVWDFVEPNILGKKAVCWATAFDIEAGAIETIIVDGEKTGTSRQIDAATGANGLVNLLVSTDPPYYDNIGYAALSDFFYVWLRKAIGGHYPDIFGTMLVPKMPELTASPERFEGDKIKAKEHFENGFRQSFTALRKKMNPHFPLTVYYAFKQDDEKSGQANGSVDLTTGWETMLEALITSGFRITATWPVRASQKWRMVAMGTNALASYIVLACRPRPEDAPQCGRRDFLNELKQALPAALNHLQQGNILPVDFAQAAIGPGMAVYSKYSRILESDGQSMTVRTALGLINQMQTEVLRELEDEFDNDTRWALAWFEQRGFSEGEFGEAELLSKAKVTSLAGLKQAGIVISQGGNVRLRRPEELSANWNPASDNRLTIWEMTHHLIRVYHAELKGEQATADLLSRFGSVGETAKDLAYRLYDICDKKKFSQDAQGYNSLVSAWPEIDRLAREKHTLKPHQQLSI
jgi:putative DNA methylase